VPLNLLLLRKLYILLLSLFQKTSLVLRGQGFSQRSSKRRKAFKSFLSGSAVPLSLPSAFKKGGQFLER
jgi:hypothetical protein